MQPIASSSSSTRGIKREGFLPPNSKRQESARDSIRVEITMNSNYTKALSNAVFLNPVTFYQIAPSWVISPYVKVANAVYQVVLDKLIEQDTCDVNFVTYDNLGLDKAGEKDREMWISSYTPSEDPPAHLSELYVKVMAAGPLNTIEGKSEKRRILSSSIEEIIQTSLSNHVFSLDQKLFLYHPIFGPLKITVDHWKQQDVDIDLMAIHSASYFGKIDKNTKIFVGSHDYDFSIVEMVNAEDIEKFCFRINRVIDISQRVFSVVHTSYVHAWEKGNAPAPLSLPLSKIKEILAAQFKEKYVPLGKVKKINFSNEWAFEIELYEVRQKPKRNFLPNRPSFYKNDKVFYFRSPEVFIQSHSHFLVTDEVDQTKTAQSLTFEIASVETQLGKAGLLLFDVGLIKEELKKRADPLFQGCHLVIKTPRANFLLSLKVVFGEAPIPPQLLCPLWKFTDTTEIRAFCAKDVAVEVVEGKPLVLSRVTISVSLELQRSDKKTILEKEELDKLFLEVIPYDRILLKDQEFSVISVRGKKLLLKVVKPETKERVQQARFQRTYRMSELTEINFEVKSGEKLLIRTQPKAIGFSDLQRKLVELGIGGISKQFVDVVSKVLLARTSLNEHASSLEMAPPRGVLLVGPPGTGKTLLARKIGELLGVTGERIKLCTGSQVYTKWLGGSEKNVREMFAAARADQEEFGDESPLHVLVVDEGDSLLRNRDLARHSWEISCVDTFLAEMDGIPSKGKQPLNNIFVVVLTNKPEIIDEACKRPGRLYPTLEIGYPDQTGRKEIFEIHTRLLREKQLLANDIDFDVLALITAGKAGAFIAGIVRQAVERSYERLWEERVAKEQVATSPCAIITMADFLSVIEGKSLDSPVLTMSTAKNDVRKDFLALGIAGLPLPVVRLVADLRIHEYYKEFLFESGHTFPRGILLHGPSGTGKTRIAKSLKELLALSDDRFYYLTASEIWPARGGELKELLEKIVAPARSLARDLKGAAPLFVIVIDNLDAVFPFRQRADQDDQSVFNLVMNEINSFMDTECHNVLFVACVNRPLGAFENGILNFGKFAAHIEVGLPNPKESKEILMHYLKRVKLSDGFNMNQVHLQVLNRTPAFIEGLVMKAEQVALRRCRTQGVDPNAMAVDVQHEVTTEDFVEAHREIKGDERWRGMFG